jgi:hypothetical protein
MSVLQELYDSEINFEIATDCDAGFRVRLGHAFSGEFKTDEWAATFDEAVEKLQKAAVRFYPDSNFSKDYRQKGALARAVSD